MALLKRNSHPIVEAPAGSDAPRRWAPPEPREFLDLTTGGTMSRQPVDLRVADLSGEATYCGDVVGCQVPTCVCQSF